MEWLNLHSSTLDSPEVIGSDTRERGVWLSLLRYCIGQENGGRIADCRAWKDRQWQQQARVTLREVNSGSRLFVWDGDALCVWGYPVEKEEEVKRKRNTAKTNGSLGGRPRTNEATQEKPTLVNSPKAEGEGEGEGERKGKGMEGEAAKPAATRRAPKLPDAAWIESLKKVEAYAGLDIGREHSKAQAWCDVRGITMTRQRFVNWLNRAERPLNGARPGKGVNSRPDGEAAKLFDYTY